VGNNRLNVVAIGYMTFSFAALPGIPGDIPRRMIQHVHGNQFRVGMVSTHQMDASLRAVPAAAARGRRGAANRHPVGRLPEAAVVSTGPSGCEARRAEQIEVRQAASRLAIFDLPTFQVFPRVADGLTESGEPLAYFLGLEGGHNYRECVAAARRAFRFHECHPAGVGMGKGEVAGLDVIGPIPCFNGPPGYIAVLVDHESAYTWVYPLTDLSYNSFQSLVRTHLIEAAVGASAHFLKAISICCPVDFALPGIVDGVARGQGRGLSPCEVALCADLVPAPLLAPASCAARQLTLRAAGYVAHGGLSPPMLRPMLMSACYAHNVRPHRSAAGPSVSRHELWVATRPYVGDLVATPGALVRDHGSYGVYVMPNPDGGSLVFKLESCALELAHSIVTEISPFVASVFRSASETSRFFAAPRDHGFGDPYLCGDDVGLATLEWVQARGLAAAACPPVSHSFVDLPDLVSDSSGEEEDADSVACALPDDAISSLRRAQDLLLGGSSDAVTAQSLLADLELVETAGSSTPPSTAARLDSSLSPLILDTGACPFVGGCPGAAASPLCLGGGAETCGDGTGGSQMIASSARTRRAAAPCAAVPLLPPCRLVSLSNEVRLVVGGYT
jgi:hypothetical protein